MGLDVRIRMARDCTPSRPAECSRCFVLLFTDRFAGILRLSRIGWTLIGESLGGALNPRRGEPHDQPVHDLRGPRARVGGPRPRPLGADGRRLRAEELTMRATPLLLTLALTLAVTTPLEAQRAYEPLNKETHRQRRAKFLEAMDGGIAIIVAAQKDQDLIYEFFVDHSDLHDFIYLTGLEGVDAWESALVLAPTPRPTARSSTPRRTRTGFGRRRASSTSIHTSSSWSTCPTGSPTTPSSGPINAGAKRWRRTCHGPWDRRRTSTSTTSVS